MNAKAKGKTATKAIPPTERRHTVQLRYLNSGAGAVCVAGSFNEWHPCVTEMLNTGDGEWCKELALLPGKYEYRFVVDGNWIPDPANPETAPNPYGEANSILTVPPS